MRENNETIQVLEERKMLFLLGEAAEIWNKIEFELFENAFENDEDKEKFLKECFEGKRKFPWHAQGQSVKITDTKLVNAAISAGGIGILGGTGVGRPEYEKEMAVPDKEVPPSREKRIEIGKRQNKKAILEEIREVRKEYPHAILGVNVLHSVGDFEEIVRAIGEQGIVDILYVGAGLPFDLSEIMEDYPKMRYMAIVSSAQAVGFLEDTSEKSKSKGKRRPDGYVYEDKIAAGHNAKIKPRHKNATAADHLREIREITSKPIIFAGGVKYQEDVQRALLPEEYGGLGLNGVGLGTRMTITEECPIPNETLKSVHLNPNIPVVRKEKFSPTMLPSTGKINEKIFWEKVDEIAQYTKIRCNHCIIKELIREKYPQQAYCGFMGPDEDFRFCIGFFLDAAIKGEPWGIYFMSVINEKDLIYIKNGKAYIPVVRESVDYTIRGKTPEWATEEK